MQNMNTKETENFIQNEDPERQLQMESRKKREVQKNRVYRSIALLLFIKIVVLIGVIIERNNNNDDAHKLMFISVLVINTLGYFIFCLIIYFLTCCNAFTKCILGLIVEIFLSIITYPMIVLTYLGYLTPIEDIFSQ